MRLRTLKQMIKREAQADLDVILDPAQSGAIVEKHINGISFGLWTLVAVLVAIGIGAIAFHSHLKWDGWWNRHVRSGVIQTSTAKT